MALTGRERIRAVLGGEKPDRLPVDVGATEFTGVDADAYGALKAGLGVEGGQIRVADPFKETVRLERTFREKLGVDAVGLFVEPLRWRARKLPDGSQRLFPGRWRTEIDQDGAEVFRHPVSEVTWRRAPGERVFRSDPPLADCRTPDEVAKRLQVLAFFDWPYHADELASEFGVRAAAKRAETAGACVLNVRAGLLGGLRCLRGERARSDLEDAPELVSVILERLADTYVARLTDILPEVAPHADVVCVAEGPAGGVTREAYRRHFRRHHERILAHVRTTCGLPIVVFVQETDPAVVREIVELGVDGVGLGSPRGPSAGEVRAAVGPSVALWGTGLGASVLETGTPADVRAEVVRAVEAAGGPERLVFSFGEALPAGTRHENLLAAVEAAREIRP